MSFDSLAGEVVEVLAAKDVARAKALLKRIHDEKTFVLADYYIGGDVLDEAARLHALHIALLSMFVKGSAGGVTGIDLLLAGAFSEALAGCRDVEPPRGLQGDLAKFYSTAVEALNGLLRRLCSKS
ncbi:MAG: hypothetical protein QXP98_01185 [Thermoproteus sp.]